MSVSAFDVPRRVPGTEATRLGDELVVLDADGRMLRGLNGTGARVWELCDGSCAVREIAFALVAELGAPAEAALADVQRFLSELQLRGLVIVDTATASRLEGGAR